MSSTTPLIIGTRGSDLALWQANFVKAELEKLQVSTELKIIKTQGDLIQHLSFEKMEGKGFFTKEIESALLKGEIDLAIHSHKDLETTNPKGLIVGAVLKRESAAELLIMSKEQIDSTEKFGLKKGAVVGTSSARRKNQLNFFRPDVEIKDLRGNVPTRIKKLRDGHYDAILLAHAGVKRLELDVSDLEVVQLNEREFVPAPAQGALAIQVREEDENVLKVVHQLNHEQTEKLIELERGVLRVCNGGCQLPLGAYAIREGGQYKLSVTYAKEVDGVPERAYFEGADLSAVSNQAHRFVLQGSQKKKS